MNSRLITTSSPQALSTVNTLHSPGKKGMDFLAIKENLKLTESGAREIVTLSSSIKVLAQAIHPEEPH